MTRREIKRRSIAQKIVEALALLERHSEFAPIDILNEASDIVTQGIFSIYLPHVQRKEMRDMIDAMSKVVQSE